MLTNLFSDIKFGEVVIFSKSEDDLALNSILAQNNHGFTLRFESGNNEMTHNMAVARRPLLLNPEMEAYVCMPINGNKIDLEPLFDRLNDCVEQNPQQIDFVRSESEACYRAKCSFNNAVFDECVIGSLCAMPGRMDVDEDDIDNTLEFDQKKWVDRLSALVLEYVAANKSLPPNELINSVISGKLQISHDNELSPIVVNGDMRIILPAYNELEIRMTPLARTVYIFFLCHPEGIILKNIGDYREQLRDIYLLVKPGADSMLADAYINELCYPGSDSLQQKLSLVKRSINRYIMPEKLAQSYYITGERGKAYTVNLAAEKITLPRTLNYAHQAK